MPYTTFDNNSSITPKPPKNSAMYVLEKNKHAQPLSNTIKQLKDDLNIKKTSRLFEVFRFKSKRNALIQTRLELAIHHLGSGDMESAKVTVKNLKSDFIRQFGTKNIWGQASKSYELVANVEKKLYYLEDSFKKHALRLALVKAENAAQECASDTPAKPK